MENDDLPESWRKALTAEAAGAAPKEREPIQPPFKLWHAFVAVIAPVAAIYACAAVSIAFRQEFPNAISAIVFYFVTMFANGGTMSRAIGREHSHFAFACRSAFAGVVCFCIAAIPFFAELYIVFLAAYVAARLIGRIGLAGIMFIGVIIFAAVFILPALALFFKGAIASTLQTESVRLALAMVAAYPLAHSLCTAAMPAENTLLGRFDAMFSGVSSALLGLFTGLVAYRTALLVAQLCAQTGTLQLNSILEFASALCGVAAGNCACMWVLFRTAYSSRAERIPLKPRATLETPESISARATPTIPRRIKPEYTRVSVDDETDIDDAT